MSNYDSKLTILDVEVKSKRAFAFDNSIYGGGIVIAVFSKKTGRQLATYGLPISCIDDIKKIKTLTALVRYAKAQTEPVPPTTPPTPPRSRPPEAERNDDTVVNAKADGDTPFKVTNAVDTIKYPYRADTATRCPHCKSVFNHGDVLIDNYGIWSPCCGQMLDSMPTERPAFCQSCKTPISVSAYVQQGCNCSACYSKLISGVFETVAPIVEQASI